VVALVAGACGLASASWADPIDPLVERLEGYFHGVDITLDPLYTKNPPEIVRLSSVSQLLGYCDLRAAGHPIDPSEIVSRADFLVDQIDLVTSGTAMDGMLAAALLGAFEATGDTTYRNQASVIVDRLLHTDRTKLTLNWGLMSAMALAKHYELTGDSATLDKTRQIILDLSHDQNLDGSFPHFCLGSKDVHYTSWISMELITIRRAIHDALIDQILEKIAVFMRSRVCENGVTRYSDRCPDRPDCWLHYYSRATGCALDYDTRGWTNELGYTALLFDHFHESRCDSVIAVLDRLSSAGRFPDKWDFFPAPDDPIYTWASSDPSVLRASVVFWSLASIMRDRAVRVALKDGGRAWLPAEGTSDHLGGSVPQGARFAVRSIRRTGWMTVDSLVVANADMNEVCRAAGRMASLAGDDLPGERSLEATCEESSPAPAPVPRVLAFDFRVAPNPAHREVGLVIELPGSTLLELAIFDMAGRRVREWSKVWYPEGNHRITWNLRDDHGARVRPGAYFVSLGAQKRVTRKFLVGP